MSLAEQFKQYVADQPSDKAIDHASYYSCAMGEFAKSIGIDGYDVAQDINVVYGHTAYMLIGNGGHFRDETAPMSNYGELSAWLNTLTQVEPQ